MPDTASDIAERMRARISELAPLIEEHRLLVEAEELLSRSITPPPREPASRARPAKSTRAKTPAKSTRAKTPAKKGGKRGRKPGTAPVAERVPAVLAASPGQTPAQLAGELGLQGPTHLYKVLPELEAQGLVRKEGREWFPPETAAQEEPAAAVS